MSHGPPFLPQRMPISYVADGYEDKACELMQEFLRKESSTMLTLVGNCYIKPLFKSSPQLKTTCLLVKRLLARVCLARLPRSLCIAGLYGSLVLLVCLAPV